MKVEEWDKKTPEQKIDLLTELFKLRHENERLRGALRSIAEGNLGDAPWQANYNVIRHVAKEALE